ncbi:MAG TPA: hypothetical protein PKO22_01550 [Treponemataceae bacterium]|nr:hypothetical protein [Treponemataceae bacterium]
MKKTLSLLTMGFALSFFSGCATSPEPVDTNKPDTNVNSTAQTGNNKPDAGNDTVIAQFDTVKITKKTYESTKSELQLVVEDLNRITYARDYQRWLTYLSDAYVKTLSDPANLEKVSASLPTKGIKLKSLKDYFTYVFVPSRQNMRVDDIQFVSPTLVYVIMELSPKNPAAIYILEKTTAGWKLAPKNQ